MTIRRLLAVALLVGFAVAAGVHYDAHDDREWPYPTDDQLYDDYDRYVGERALLFGTVRSVDRDAGTATVVVEDDGRTSTLSVQKFDADVEPGGYVQVYGTLEADHAMTATTVIVVERTHGDRLFKYVSSVAGAVVALAAFFRHWRVDPTTVTFRPR